MFWTLWLSLEHLRPLIHLIHGMIDMQWYKEWASKVSARAGRMLPVEAFSTIQQLPNPGYSSVYMFKESDAEKIKHTGSSKGLGSYEVAAQHLILDIDSGDDGLEYVGNRLQSAGLAFHLWSSGGKGYHIYIDHALCCSLDLPYTHSVYAEKLAGECFDRSLYQHGRLISLPGRVHPKTGNKKVFLRTFPGTSLELELQKAPPKPNFDALSTSDEDLLFTGLRRVSELLKFPPFPGNRHTQIWSIAETLAQAGCSYATVLELMTKVNDSWEQKKPYEELERAVQQAFKLMPSC